MAMPVGTEVFSRYRGDIMDLGLKDRTALVTAGSRGFGRAVAMRLASEGARVALCARGEEDLMATAA